MLLDWFTVFAQLLNFFVLLILLRVFLYGPVIKAMQERKERVAAEMAEVRRARAEADDLKDDLRIRQDELDNRASEVMAQIHAEAEKWKEQATASARAEIDTLRREWLAELALEKEAVALNLRNRLTHEVAATAARMVRDLADSEIEELVLSGFMRRIESEVREVDCGKSDILLRTGFEQSGSQLEKLESVLDTVFPPANERIVLQDSRLGLGMELIAGDRKWEWNLASYVSELEQKILEEIRE